LSAARDRHIPGLDGLRGLAILAVIVFHTMGASSQIASVGWMGVDLFFVLSGFLITGILIDARTEDAYFRTFYARRVLRIVPVYVAFLAVCLWTRQLAPSVQGWYWSYLVNVWLAVRGWASGPTHLWSLAVEEQFYLVWPLVVWLLPPRALPRVAIGCVVVAELCRIALALAGADPRVSYLLLPTRMDALAVGAFLACAVRDKAILESVLRCRWWGAGVALCTLATARVLAHSFDFQRVEIQLLGYLAIAALSGSLVLAVSQQPMLFANPVLRFFGRYSYGIYVWHWLVMAILPPLHGRWAFVVVLGVTSAVALASWYLIEQPFLRLKRFVPYSPRARRTVSPSLTV
jgi:peptidoglycan/LPS O-acetylase OafA/YrhL